MGDRLSAERACKDPNPIIDGRKANVNLAILGAKPRGNLATGKLIALSYENKVSYEKYDLRSRNCSINNLALYEIIKLV